MIIIGVLLSVGLICRYSQYILAWQVNQKINVGGIRLMMSEDEVKRQMGEAEEYLPGFGCYRLNYTTKGLFLTFLEDRDTNFYHKVNEIEINDPAYEVFGVRVGDDFDKSTEIMDSHGLRKEANGSLEYKKASMYIRLDRLEGKVSKIIIGIHDRISSKRIY